MWEQIKPTVIFVTHDIDEALFLADTVHVMSARPGRIETTLKVDLPRPRTIDLTATQAFSEMKLSILRTIRGH